MSSERLKQIAETLGLLNSMVNSGEQHSERSLVTYEEGRAALTEMLNEQLQADKLVWRRERVEEIVKVLFPRYNRYRVKQGQDVKPPIHPDVDWWWNGAFVEEYEEVLSGGVEVRVSSYTGSNEYANFDMKIPDDWIEAGESHWKDLVLQFIETKKTEKDAKHRQKVIDEAHYQLREAQRKLESLTKNS